MSGYYSPNRKVLTVNIKNGRAFAEERNLVSSNKYDPRDTSNDEIKGIFKWSQYREYETGTVVEFENNIYILVGQPESNGTASKDYVFRHVVVEEEPTLGCGCCHMSNVEKDKFLLGANYKVQESYPSFKSPKESTVWKKVELESDNKQPKNVVILHSLADKKLMIEVV